MRPADRPIPTMDLLRSISASVPPTRHIIDALDVQPCVLSMVMCTANFISGQIEFNPVTHPHMTAIYENLVRAAEHGGFKERDLLDEYVKRNKWTSCALDLLEEMIEHAGGALACLDILDLTNFEPFDEEMQ